MVIQRGDQRLIRHQNNIKRTKKRPERLRTKPRNQIRKEQEDDDDETDFTLHRSQMEEEPAEAQVVVPQQDAAPGAPLQDVLLPGPVEGSTTDSDSDLGIRFDGFASEEEENRAGFLRGS